MQVCNQRSTGAKIPAPSAVLFGSAADGSLRKSSDVNLILVLRRYDPARAQQIRDDLATAEAAILLRVMFLVQDEIPAACDQPGRAGASRISLAPVAALCSPGLPLPGRTNYTRNFAARFAAVPWRQPAVWSPLEILDLRHFSSVDLRPLLEDETLVWSRLLSWDYRASSEMILRYADTKILPGYAAVDRGPA